MYLLDSHRSGAADTVLGSIDAILAKHLNEGTARTPVRHATVVAFAARTLGDAVPLPHVATRDADKVGAGHCGHDAKEARQCDKDAPRGPRLGVLGGRLEDGVGALREGLRRNHADPQEHGDAKAPGSHGALVHLPGGIAWEEAHRTAQGRVCATVAQVVGPLGRRGASLRSVASKGRRHWTKSTVY